jgi:hypothetical protein
MKIGVACLLALLLFSTFGAAPVPKTQGLAVPGDSCLQNCQFKWKGCFKEACSKAGGTVNEGFCSKDKEPAFSSVVLGS